VDFSAAVERGKGTYSWPNEFKPRRALVRHLAGPIAPGQSLAFDETIPDTGLAGTFETRVTILGYRYQEAREPESPPPAPDGDATDSALPLPDLVAAC